MNHRECHDWGCLVFWKSNEAVDVSDADRQVLEVGFGVPVFSLSFGVQESDHHKALDLVCALDAVFAFGKARAKKEIREALGVAEPGSWSR